MSTELIIALLTFAFVSSVTPGPNNLMLMASGANFGALRSTRHMAGIVFGFQFMLLMVGLGLIRLFDAWPTSYLILKILSAGFLIYLAWKIATADAPIGEDGTASTSKPLTFFQAAMFQWVNPKAWALCLASLSAYSVPEHPIKSQIVIGLAFIVAGVPSITSWTILGTQIRRILSNPGRLRAFNWTCAGLLVASLWPILAKA